LIEDWPQRIIDKGILLALAEEPFASVRRVASKTLISRTTVYPHLGRVTLHDREASFLGSS
jgi:hypothetical protein